MQGVTGKVISSKLPGRGTGKLLRKVKIRKFCEIKTWLKLKEGKKERTGGREGRREGRRKKEGKEEGKERNAHHWLPI